MIGFDPVVAVLLVFGQDFGGQTDNRAVRDYLRFKRPRNLTPTAQPILDAWHRA